MKRITEELVSELNEAVLNDDCQNFFEALGFYLYDLGDDRYELSGVYTNGGVEMCLTIEKEDWKTDFKDYWDNFDVDEEISLYREDPNSSYCKEFTCRQSVEDFEEWDNYIKQLVEIIDANGEYKLKKNLYHTTVGMVLLFPKDDFDLKILNKLDDDELMQLTYQHGNIDKKTIDDFVGNINSDYHYIKDYYVKMIEY